MMATHRIIPRCDVPPKTSAPPFDGADFCLGRIGSDERRYLIACSFWIVPAPQSFSPIS